MASCVCGAVALTCTVKVWLAFSPTVALSGRASVMRQSSALPGVVPSATSAEVQRAVPAATGVPATVALPRPSVPLIEKARPKAPALPLSVTWLPLPPLPKPLSPATWPRSCWAMYSSAVCPTARVSVPSQR